MGVPHITKLNDALGYFLVQIIRDSRFSVRQTRQTSVSRGRVVSDHVPFVCRAALCLERLSAGQVAARTLA
jgi:hypothetical protein